MNQILQRRSRERQRVIKGRDRENDGDKMKETLEEKKMEEEEEYDGNKWEKGNRRERKKL